MSHYQLNCVVELLNYGLAYLDQGTYRHGRNYVGDTGEVSVNRVHEFKCLSK